MVLAPARLRLPIRGDAQDRDSNHRPWRHVLGGYLSRDEASCRPTHDGTTPDAAPRLGVRVHKPTHTATTRTHAVPCPAVTTPTPPRRHTPILAITLAALIAAAAATGITIWATTDDQAKPTTATEVEIDGTITLGIGDFTWSDSPVNCSGHSGYHDITQGTQVTITDPAGKVLAIGKLGYGKPTLTDGRATTCTLPFHTYVAAGHGIYGIEVSHRGKVQTKEAELGKVELTLG